MTDLNEISTNALAADDRAPVLELDLGENGGIIAFYSMGEADSWFQSEQKYWAGLVQGSGYSHPLNLAAEAMEFIRRGLENARSTGSFGILRETMLRELGPTGRLVHSSSFAGQLLIDIEREHGYQGLRAAYAVAIQTDSGDFHSVTASRQGFAGAVTMFNGRWGVTRRSSAAALQSLQMLANRREAQWHDDRAAVETHLAEATNSAAKFENAFHDRLAQHQLTREQELSKLLEERTRVLGELDSTNRLFREQLRLKAPSEYWEAKAVEHQRKAKELLRSILWSVGVGAIAYVAVLLWQWVNLIELLKSFAANTAGLLVVSGLVALIAALPLWFLRILVRFYLSEQHLATDARERKVMTMTYLALSDGGSVAEKDRAIILASLFRASQDGIVKDAGGPDASPAALLARFLDGGR